MAVSQADVELMESLMIEDDDEVTDVAGDGNAKAKKHAKETKATSKAGLSAEQVAEKRLAAQRLAKRNKTALKKLNLALKGRGLNMDEFISEEDSFVDSIDKAINDMVKAENLVDDRDVMLVNARIFPQHLATADLLQCIFTFITDAAEAANGGGKALQQNEIKSESEDKKETVAGDAMQVKTTGKRKTTGGSPAEKKPRKKAAAGSPQAGLATEPGAPAQPLAPSDPRPATPAPDQPPAKPEEQEKAHAKAKKPRAKKQAVAKQEEANADVVMTDA
jgi:hypothetical protein